MSALELEHQSAGHRAGSLRPLLVNIAQAGEMLCVSRTTLYELMWSGELTPVHIGRSVRFTVAQLEDFVSRRIADAA